MKLYAKKRDLSEPAIVEALEARGFEIHKSLPVDLLALKWVTFEQLQRATERRNGRFRLVTLVECKTPKKSGKAPKRNDQQEQSEFCDRWSVVKATRPMDALLMVGERVTL